MDNTLRDVQYAWQALRKAKGTALVSSLVLSTAIAAAATGFSFVNTALLRPLPYPASEQLHALSARRPDGIEQWSAMPLRAVDAIRHGSRSFARVGAYAEHSVVVAAGGDTMELSATSVDSAVLALLDARAERGRLLSRDEIAARSQVAVISDSLWRRQFGAREDIVGRHIGLEGRDYTVIGVAARGFRFDQRSDVWIPLDEKPDTLDAVHATQYSVVARLLPRVPLSTARSELALIGHRLAMDDPVQFKGWSLTARDGLVQRDQNGLARASFLLFGVSLCVLLIACANVANLQLVRAARRRGEMAVRATLGATSARLFRLVLAENLLIGLAASTAGALLSYWGVQLLASLLPTFAMPSWVHLGIDWRVLAFVAATTTAAVAACAFAASRIAARTDLTDALKVSGGTTVIDVPLIRVARKGVVIQMALSFALFVSAALCARSYTLLLGADLGYEASRVLLVQAPLRNRYPSASARLRYYRDFEARLEHDSKVAAVAIRGWLAGFPDTLIPGRRGQDPGSRGQPTVDRYTGLYLPSDPTVMADGGMWPATQTYVVSDGYFRVLGLSLKAGRSFSAFDVAGASRVAVVSERLAQHLWSGQNPVGRMVFMGSTKVPLTVIGVVSDVRGPFGSISGGSVERLPMLYLSDRQATPYPELVVRAVGDPAALWPTVQTVAGSLDPLVRIGRMRTLAEDLISTLAAVRTFGSFIGCLAICGLGLALVGIYAVISFAMEQRRREIGIRIALGGQPQRVVAFFVTEGMRLVALGLASGLLVSVAGTRALRVVFYGMTPADPLTYAGAATLFALVALLACWLPARRAAFVDPLDALRSL